MYFQVIIIANKTDFQCIVDSSKLYRKLKSSLVSLQNFPKSQSCSFCLSSNKGLGDGISNLTLTQLSVNNNLLKDDYHVNIDQALIYLVTLKAID
jgi:hypothetical protein